MIVTVLMIQFENFLADSFKRCFAFRLAVLAATIANDVSSPNWHSAVDVSIVNQSAESIVVETGIFNCCPWKSFRKVSVQICYVRHKFSFYWDSRERFVIVMSNDRHQKFSARLQRHGTFVRFKFDAFVKRHELLTATKRANKLLTIVNQMT